MFGSTWVFDLTFTSDGAARFTLTVTKEGHLPTMVEGVVDFHGDGISVDEFPEELLLPDDPPQASGEDVSGVEVAAAITTTRIGGDDLQTMLVSASGADHQPGDWLEPKDGSNQRMIIVSAGQGTAVAAVDADVPITAVGTGRDDLPLFLASAPDPEYPPGDGLERKDGINQRMTTVDASLSSAIAAVEATAAITTRPNRPR